MTSLEEAIIFQHDLNKSIYVFMTKNMHENRYRFTPLKKEQDIANEKIKCD